MLRLSDETPLYGCRSTVALDDGPVSERARSIADEKLPALPHEADTSEALHTPMAR